MVHCRLPFQTGGDFDLYSDAYRSLILTRRRNEVALRIAITVSWITVSWITRIDETKSISVLEPGMGQNRFVSDLRSPVLLVGPPVRQSGELIQRVKGRCGTKNGQHARQRHLFMRFSKSDRSRAIL